MELVAIFKNKPLDFPPGKERKYSNPGYYLLGYIIEQASGQKYADYVREKGKRIKIYHQGSNPGFAAYIARYPEDRTFVIVLSNLETSPVGKIADDLAGMAWGETVSAADEKKN